MLMWFPKINIKVRVIKIGLSVAEVIWLKNCTHQFCLLKAELYQQPPFPIRDYPFSTYTKFSQN